MIRQREHKKAQNRERILSRPIAHRGLYGDGIPENSMPAYAAAMQAGCSIEIDVQLTQDGVPVLFHDDNLLRMTGVKKRLTRLRHKDLRGLRLEGTEYGIPTLAEFLHFVGGAVPILVEIKRNRGSKGIERVVCDMLSGYDGSYAVQSFNPLAVRQVKKIDPSIFCGLLSSKFEDLRLMFLKKEAVRNARLFFIAKPDFISFEIGSFPNRRIASFRDELGLPVLGWTVQTKEDIERALKYCDNIIFENIENLRKHMEEAGDFFGIARLT
ncbi:MAG: glycerophosphodiester phosphodiesterase [Clostridiales Family XIII bacterium]|jgi:glycerophosphoryl diester phosphodiesterase|nr:glycerophosphodiester phosphodiesterase [Clostridiales Family XIII bacterium]